MHASNLPTYGVEDIENSSGPRGLLQGSPASSVILAWFINGILLRMPKCDNARIVVCFDNIYVAGRTRAGLRTMVDILAEAFDRCSFGPLELSPPKLGDADGLDVMGYLVSPDGRIGLSHRALCKLERRLCSAEERDSWETGEVPFRTWRALRRFRTGFSAAEDIRSELAYYIENSRELAEATGSPLISYLHESVFARSSSFEGKFIEGLIEYRAG